MTEIDAPKTRRAVLGAAAAAAVAVAADAFIHPHTAAAGTGTMVYGSVNNNAGTDRTALTSSSSAETLSVDNSGSGIGLAVSAAGLTSVAIYGLAEKGYGVIGDISILDKGFGGIGVWGRDRDIPGKIATAGTSYSGTGVVGYVADGASDAVPPTTGGMTGVYGYAPGGTGVAARSDTGTALQVTGKAAFSRSGRVTLIKGRSYVDVDLRTKGGLSGSPLCFANILSRRGGVHIETVRPNYPVAGKLRIYLNKVASATSSTTLAWIVMG